MAKVRVFWSFEFDKDAKLRGDFFAQAERGDSGHYILDYSLPERYPEKLWLDKAKKQIEQCDIVIVLVGQDTHNAPGVEKEVTIANQKGKPIFQIRPQGQTWGEVKGARELIPWDWDKIDEKIDELLS